MGMLAQAGIDVSDNLKQWGLTGILLVFIIEKMTACIIAVVGKVRGNPESNSMSSNPPKDTGPAPVSEVLCQARVTAMRDLMNTKFDMFQGMLEAMNRKIDALLQEKRHGENSHGN